jgi:4-amino-4-deoxy-L-arabinose transferase-like glycosyltransferase
MNSMSTTQLFWLGCLAATFLRYLLAAYIPLTNDEVYYWDWARELHLSYLDHPPGVAWLAALAQNLFPLTSPLSARGLVPVVYLVATWFVVQTARLLKEGELGKSDLIVLFAGTQLVPGFSLLGFLLLPDSGLLLCLSIALWATIRIDKKAQRTTTADLALLGLAIGLAVDCKYHAVLICPGFAAALLWRRKIALVHIGVIAVTATVAALPPIIWNWQNGFASFVFQSSHGFSELSLSPAAALRAAIGIFLFFGPWYLIRTLRASAGFAILLLAAIPITLLFLALAWVKQVMPHWFIPGLWVALPFLIFVRPRRITFPERAYCFALAWCLPGLFALSSVREHILKNFDGKPGPYAEISIWPDAARVADALVERTKNEMRCSPTVTGLRWYWAAQMAFAMDNQPRVGNFDPSRASYYTFRDSHSNSPCPSVLIGYRDQIGAATQYFEITHREEVTLPLFKDQPLVLAVGHLIHAAQPLSFRY